MKSFNVAGVVDKFTACCLEAECNFYQFDYENFEYFDSTVNVDIFFVESAWFGFDNKWFNIISRGSDVIIDIVNHYKLKGVPTVFWCKEDPVHFHRFLKTAAAFDYVFTSDINSIPLYKILLKHTRVFLLPFACQPLQNNPILAKKRHFAAAFAGSFYAKYPDRIKDLSQVVLGVTNCCELAIFDRYKDSDDSNYKFPEEYQRYIKGSLSVQCIDEAYKGYQFGINLNTVKTSESMFARRVFELLGSGTPTISNYSSGIDYLFSEIVIASDDSNEISLRLKKWVDSEQITAKTALLGLRKVMLEHTYSHRMSYIMQKVFGAGESPLLPSITVLAEAHDIQHIKIILRNISSQKIKAKLVLIVSDQLIEQASIWVVKEYVSLVSSSQADKKKIRDVVNDSAWIAGMSVYDYYGENYLLDLVLGSCYSQAKAFGKVAFFEANSSTIELINKDFFYHQAAKIKARSGIFSLELISDMTLSEWLNLVEGNNSIDVADCGQALDYFNYCAGFLLSDLSQEQVANVVDDLKIDIGHSINDLYAKADNLRIKMPQWIGKKALRLDKLASVFGNLNNSNPIHAALDQFGWHLVSEIPDGDYAVIWAENSIPLSELGGSEGLKFHIVEGPGLLVNLVVRFETTGGRLLKEQQFNTNINQSWIPPVGTAYIQLGWRVFSSGTTRVMKFVLEWL